MRGTFGLNRFLDLFLSKENKNSSKKDIRKSKKNSKNKFLLIAGSSIFIAAIYFYGIGRNRFFTTSDVVVRKAGSETLSGIGLTSLFSVGNSGSLEDARYLKSYLLSPQILEDLEKEIKFKEIYIKKFPDFLSGLPNNPTREMKYVFFQKQISVILDEISGILTINTYAFDRETSYKINKFLINQAESFVNKLNQDIFKKQLSFAKKEVGSNLDKFNKASSSLEKFQLENKSLDLSFDASASSSLLSTLESNLAQKKVELATLKRKFLSPSAPEILEVQALVDEIENLIEVERQLLVSPTGKNLNKKITILNKLKSELIFAEDLYKSALATAESTRIDSLQQQRFMASLSKPFLAEEPWNYWRHKGFLTVLVVIVLIYTLSQFILGLSDAHVND